MVALGTAVINPSLGYGIDCNPVADFGTGASLRLISSSGSNFAVNVATGVVGNQAGNFGAGFTGAGDSDSNPLPVGLLALGGQVRRRSPRCGPCRRAAMRAADLVGDRAGDRAGDAPEMRR